MSQTWEVVARADQTVLATLDDRRENCSIELQCNGLWTAKALLSLEDPAAQLVASMDTCLRVTDDSSSWDRPVFLGRILNPDATSAADQEGVTLNAVSPWHHLEKSFIHRDPDLALAGLEADLAAAFGPTPRIGISFGLGYDDYPAAVDQLQILWAIVGQGDATATGIVAGSLPASFNRTAVYPAGTRVSEAIEAMCALLSGPDVELTPVEETDGTLAEFNGFYPRQGSDKSATVEVTFGIGEDDSATEFSYTPSGEQFCNRFIAVGSQIVPADPELTSYPGNPTQVYVADHATSQSAFGRHSQLESVSELGDYGTLEAYAKAAVSQNAYPIEFFGFSMAPQGEGGTPTFGPAGDFYLGDTITGRAQLPGWDDQLELSGRVVSVTIEEKDSGTVIVKPTLVPELLSSGVTGQAETWVTLTGEAEE